MHVLAATNNLYPDPGATGSGRYNYEVGRRLAERGHTVSVVTRLRGDVPERETVEGMDVYRYEASIPRLPKTLGCLADIVESVRPLDLVSCHGALSSVGVDRAVPDSVARTYTVHGLWSVEYDDRLVDPSRWAAPWHWANRAARHRIEGRVLANCDRTVALSEFQRGRVEAHHDHVPPVTVVPGGVDVERFTPDAGGSALVPTDRPTVLTVRRLTPRMGVETLLDAFAAAETGDTQLLVAGDGPLRSELEQHAERLGIAGDVRFLGYVPDDELGPLYASADLFVLPTLELEGFGLVTLEALASGTPVVGTTAGATPELLTDLAASPDVPAPLLVPPGDADALAAAMDAWTGLSAADRERAGRACRSYIRDSGYSWTAVTDRVEALFGELVGNR